MIQKEIKTKLLEPNTGQIEGLPRNPRKWTAAEIEKLKKSIEETPELLQARPLLVCPAADKFVVLGGNLRFEAIRKIKSMKDAPCIVLEGMDIPKLKEIVLKDNSSFGGWDADELANFWDDLPLEEWGVNVAGLDESLSYEGSNKEMDTDSWTEDMAMKFHFSREQFEWIKDFFKDKDPRLTILSELGYEQN